MYSGVTQSLPAAGIGSQQKCRKERGAAKPKKAQAGHLHILTGTKQEGRTVRIGFAVQFHIDAAGAGLTNLVARVNKQLPPPSP
jgi:hypothetical protein